MKKICLVVGNTLPVPAVMGGAVEELITMLLDQNEIEQKQNLLFSQERIKRQKGKQKSISIPELFIFQTILFWIR